MGEPEWYHYLAPSFTDHDRVRKFACLFAGLGHLQPLLLTTTNSHYLLDRFCMERCCSGEYISRIVTSLIFMEVMATLLVAGTVVTYSINNPDFASSKTLNENEKEGPYRRYVSIATQCFILLGYFQIFYAFTTGGRKGHMEWFYLSLAIQYFLICIIAGAIGFWEVGLALWYLVTLPMAPIIVFFYQMIIHSWIRNNGPRYPERLIVEYQIWLALCISSVAIACWIFGYAKAYTPVDLNPDSSKITKNPEKTRTLRVYNVALTVTGSGQTKKEITIQATNSGSPVNVTIHSITLTRPTVTLYPGKVVTVVKAAGGDGKSVEAKVEASLSGKTVTIEIKKTVGAATDGTLIWSAKVPGATAASATISKIYLEYTGTIEVKKAEGGGGAGQDVTAETTQPIVTGYSCYPNYGKYISGVQGATGTPWKSEWDGGKCFYAECYKNDDASKALLKLHISGGLSSGIRYFGKSSTWKMITEDNFNNYLKELLATGDITNITGESNVQDPDYNTDFTKVLCDGWTWDKLFTWPWNWWKFTPVKYPLLMQGLSVGAVGSIFPNLIPKTLTCPKTTRTLTVVNMFLVPLPHIINLALADNGWPTWSPGTKWTNENWGWLWLLSWLLYIFYGLAFLFAIFNAHSPEWKLCCYIRSHGWMSFMMTLSITLIIEILIAIARAGIMMQRPASPGKDKNHPLLWNKIFCLMGLSYLPFWLTTTPMMKSYVSSLDPFLCDKDRDHWPTARYGRLRSFGYWCKCACRGLYNSPRKLVTLNMRKALTRKDPKVYFLVTHDIPPEGWLWTLSCVIILTSSLLTHPTTSYYERA